MAAHWTDSIDDAAIRAVVGADTFVRGASYAREGRVEQVTGSGGSALLGEVRGSGRQRYSTLVTPAPTSSRSSRQWSGRCSCPVGTDCKHAVAVLLAARGLRAFVPAGVGTARGWEGAIGQLVRSAASDDEPTGAPLALQLEVVTPPPAGSRGYGRLQVQSPSQPQRRVLLRPLVRSPTGAWIRGGASWRELESGYAHYGRPLPLQSHREALIELYGLSQARSRGHHSAGDRPVHLDEVGPSVWRLLRQAVAAGVELVSATTDGEVVRLADEPARTSLDLRRDGRSGDATLEALVTVAGASVGAGSAVVVGTPAHGVVVERPDGLLLAPLDEPATAQVSELLHDGRALEVPAADLGRFLREYYPGLRQLVEVTSSDASVEFPEVRPPRLSLRVAHEPGHELDLTWGFAYPVGDEVVRVPLDGALDTGAVRDRDAEQALLEALDLPDRGPRLHADTGGRPALLPHVRLSGLDTVAFVQELLPDLLERDDLDVEVTGSPADYRYTEAAPLIQVSATESAERDWFDLGVTVTVDGEEIPFHPLFVALTRGDSHLVLDSGTWFSIERPELAQLRTLIEEARGLQDRESDGMRISAYQADLWDELSALGVVQEQSERWTRAVRGLLDVDEVTPAPLPAGLEADLRPYQLTGYQWLAFLQEHELGGILADDMGLGKTLQVLAMVARAVERGVTEPFLVVAPTSVVPNWVHEAARFTPGLRVTAVQRTSSTSGVSVAEQADGAHVVVTSYALFRIDNPSYTEVAWAGLLLDEAQFVKNHQGRTHLSARRLPAPFKLAITGTPLENNLMELWSLLSIVAPGLYPNPKRFTQQYANPIAKGDSEKLARLRRRVRPLMRRRTKEQVATELPPKVEQVLEVSLNPRHRRIYQTHLQRERQKVLRLIDDPNRNRFAILRSLTLLRRLSLDPALVDDAYTGVAASKVDVLAERLQEVIEEGHRALVFSQFTGFLRTVRDRLDADGVAYSYLDGRTRDRARRIEEFRRGENPVFLISLKAGGVGLNLTEADYVFILDPWWNPAVEAQAVDRTHRIGQDSTVMVYRLVATDTIEEKVMQLKERKLELFSSVMDDDGALAGPLTGEDIAGLLEM